nr:R3H domain-containing nucleic acid-binding protein [Ruania alba]
MLDVGGYRQQRKEELTRIANEAIERVKNGEERVALTAMNPFERKVVHDVVADAGLVSDSEGTEPNRHVVVRSGE